MRVGRPNHQSKKKTGAFPKLEGRKIENKLPGLVKIRLETCCLFSSVRTCSTTSFYSCGSLIKTQATNGNSGSRELTVEVQLGGTSFLVVSDNGAGMDAVGLQDLATYFRTQVLHVEHRRAALA